MRKITDRLWYVGVNDRRTALFESLWPIPKGVTYNSYLVHGDSACALIDGTEASEVDALKRNVKATLGCLSPRYLVVNHMEPDHSGGIRALLDAFPEMVMVGNSKTLEMARGFYNISDGRMMEVKDNDCIDLGGVSLTFRLTPMVHWPETMMTYSPEIKAIFSGDAFGCFGALNGAVVDRDMDTDWYLPEMERYYATIVGKYGLFVQKAIAKTSDLDVEYLCPTHGPVWHDRIKEVVAVYDRLSRYEAREGVTIVYGSMYGNTERMAEIVAERLAERGIREIRMHNAAYTDLSVILADIFRYKGLVVGAPTYNSTLFPPIEAVLSAIKTRDIKDRVVGAFGCYSWGPQAVKRINAAFADCKLLLADMPSAESRYTPGEEEIESFRALADTMVEKIHNS